MAGLPNFAQEPSQSPWFDIGPLTKKAIDDKKKEIDIVQQSIVDTTPTQQNITGSMNLVDQYNQYAPENSPEAIKAMAELARYQEESRQGQIQGIEEAKQRLSQYAQQPDQLNLSPLINLVDNWTGSNLLRGYSQPKSNAEAINALQSAILKSKGQLTESDVANAKYKLGDIKGRGDTIAGLIKDQARIKAEKEQKQDKGGDRDYQYTKNDRVKFDSTYGKQMSGLSEFAKNAHEMKNIIVKNNGVPLKGGDALAYDSALKNLIINYNTHVAGLGALAGEDIKILLGGVGQSGGIDKYLDNLIYKPQDFIKVLDKMTNGTDQTIEKIGDGQRLIYSRGETEDLYNKKREHYYRYKVQHSSEKIIDPSSLTQEQRDHIHQERERLKAGAK